MELLKNKFGFESPLGFQSEKKVAGIDIEL